MNAKLSIASFSARTGVRLFTHGTVKTQEALSLLMAAPMEPVAQLRMGLGLGLRSQVLACLPLMMQRRTQLPLAVHPWRPLRPLERLRLRQGQGQGQSWLPWATRQRERRKRVSILVGCRVFARSIPRVTPLQHTFDTIRTKKSFSETPHDCTVSLSVRILPE